MKRTLLLIGVVAALLLSTAACGGTSDDEQKASDNIAKSFAGSTALEARKAVADCFGDELVTSAGVDQLKKDKVIDKKLKAASQLPDQAVEEDRRGVRRRDRDVLQRSPSSRPTSRSSSRASQTSRSTPT